MSEDRFISAIETIEKQNQGTMLALNALAEVLQKMNGRVEKSEMTEIEKQQMEVEKSQRNALVKEVTDQVVTALKKDFAGLVELHGNDPKKVSGTKWPMGSNPAGEDKESNDPVDTKTETVQKPVLAMAKTGSSYTMKVENEEDKVDAELGEEENGAEEYPMEEDKGEMKYPDNMKAYMAKMKADLTKEFEKKMSVAVQKETESRLRKMGFREENQLTRPQMLSKNTMGLNSDAAPLAKSANKKALTPDEVVDELAKLPYSKLCEMQIKMASGQTDGLPRELVG